MTGTKATEQAVTEDDYDITALREIPGLCPGEPGCQRYTEALVLNGISGPRPEGRPMTVQPDKDRSQLELLRHLKDDHQVTHLQAEEDIEDIPPWPSVAWCRARHRELHEDD